jgi:DNA-binding transcriptional MerR regulator
VAVRKTAEKIDFSELRTIGDVADALGLPAHVLRFWETRFREIAPVKRAGGRRFYRPRDIELVDAIRRLLYDEGYTIKGVQRILKEQGIDAVLAQIATLDAGADVNVAPARAEDPAPPPRIEPRHEAAPAPMVLPPSPLPPGPAEPGSSWRGSLAPPPAANEQTPPVRLDPSRERLLREALAEIEECRRLLALTRR